MKRESTTDSPYNIADLILSNSLIPGLLAGNALILKPSPQTPSSSTTVCALLQKAGLPDGVAQTLHLTPDQLDRLVGDPRIGYVQFTGSVANGRRVEKNAVGKSAGQGFKGVGLELGGKDAAYVREGKSWFFPWFWVSMLNSRRARMRSDADVPYSAENIADGAFFNSGQSCCAVERVYVHEKVYDEFVEKLVQEAKVRLSRSFEALPPLTGSIVVDRISNLAIRAIQPLHWVLSLASKRLLTSERTFLMRVRAENSKRTNVLYLTVTLGARHVTYVVEKGAHLLLHSADFPASELGTTYVSPNVLVDVNHGMKIMMDETFGPVVGVMKVSTARLFIVGVKVGQNVDLHPTGA